MLDGNCLEARERRLKVLRAVEAGAVPGQSLVVSEPAHALVSDVLPGADGHAQERSLFGQVLHTVHAGARWIADRHVCPRELLGSVDTRGAVFIRRPHEGLPGERLKAFRAVGRIETGRVAEQRVQGRDAQGGPHLLRRIQVQRDPPARDGDRGLSILPHIPLRQASATRIARLDRQRWTLETAFQHREASCQSAMNT